MIWKTNSIQAVIQTLKINLGVCLLLSMLSCAGKGTVPAWYGEIWPGKPEIGGVVRTESDGTTRAMLATDENFRKGAWISYADIRKLFVIVQSCKKWKRGLPMMSASEALTRFKPIIEDMEREAELESIDDTSKDQMDLILQISPEINKTVTE